jgi:phospho-N-acetylmuramoyl-pentapeptide-transferase
MIEQAPMPFALALATVSFFLAVVWGQPLINLLRRRSIGKQIRIEGPSGHQSKMGTPTMGGVLFLVPVFLITVILNLANFLSGVEWGKAILRVFNFAEGSPLIGKSILVPLLVLIGFGLLGARDDWAGIFGRRHDGQGLIARIKASEVLLALATRSVCFIFSICAASRSRA